MTRILSLLAVLTLPVMAQTADPFARYGDAIALKTALLEKAAQNFRL